jgi:pyruvate formate-lyase activating enzyme-like uncharacterized protein
LKNNQYINDFISEGLDEIRFHPSIEYWNKMDKNPISKIIKDTINKDIDVAIEIPSVPDMKDEMLSLIKWSNDNCINWININELEISERNAKKLLGMNFINKNNFSSTIKGSEDIAYEILKKISQCDYEIGVHYCSCSFKEGIQLTNRLKRRAKRIVKKHEIVSNEGTLIKGVIYPNNNLSLENIYEKLINDFKIKEKKIFINYDKKRIEMKILELNRISSKLLDRGLSSYLIEEYPTADGLEVEKIPLPIR